MNTLSKMTITMTLGLIALTAGCADDSAADAPVEGRDTAEGDDGDDDDGTDDDTDTDTDQGLLLWPQAYQDFIADVGGAKFVEVDDVLMHYVDTGPADGETILLIHGIPTHSYLWRDVIPEFTGKRVIAVDLVGYGRSERPEGLPYTPQMQIDFLEEFVDELELDELHLVVHDLGGPVGLGWATQNPERVKSITMFESLWTTLPSIDVIPPPFGELLVALRTPDVGEMLVGEQNVFLAALNDFTVDGVSPEDQAVYTFPWQDPADRIAVFLTSGPRSFPVPEDPAAFDFFTGVQSYLTQDDVPKLVFDISPGTLSGIEIPGPDGDLRVADFAAQVFPNTTLLALDGAGHFVQEDRPVQLGAAINTFIDDVN